MLRFPIPVGQGFGTLRSSAKQHRFRGAVRLVVAALDLGPPESRPAVHHPDIAIQLRVSFGPQPKPAQADSRQRLLIFKEDNAPFADRHN